MSQLTFAEAEYEGKKRKTRREKFLERMDKLIPWKKLERQLAKKYSQGKTAAQTVSIARHVAHSRDAVALQSERSSYGRCAV